MVSIRITLLLGFLLHCKNVIPAIETSICGKFLSRYVFAIRPSSNDIVRLTQITEKIPSAIVKRPKVDGRPVRVIVKPEDFENFYRITQEENIYLNHRHVCVDPKELNDLTVLGEYNAGLKLDSKTGVLHPLGNSRYFVNNRGKKLRRFSKSKVDNFVGTSLWNDWKKFDVFLSSWKEGIEDTLRKMERKFNEIKRLKFSADNYSDIFSSSKMSSSGSMSSLNDTDIWTTDVSVRPPFTVHSMEYAPGDRMLMEPVTTSGVRSTKGLWKYVNYTTRAPKDLKELRRKQKFRFQDVIATTISSNSGMAKKGKGGKKENSDKKRNADKAKMVKETDRTETVNKKVPVAVKATTRKGAKNHKTTSAPRGKKKTQTKSTTVRTKVSSRKPNLSKSGKDKKHKHDSKASTKYYSKRPTTRSPKSGKSLKKGQKKSENKRNSVLKNKTISSFQNMTASNGDDWEKWKVTSRTSMKPRQIYKWVGSRNMSKSSDGKKYKNSTGMHEKRYNLRVKRDNWHFLRHNYEIYIPESHCPHPESAVGCGYGDEYTTKVPTTAESEISTEEGTATVEPTGLDPEPLPPAPPPGLDPEPLPPAPPPGLDPEPLPPAPPPGLDPEPLPPAPPPGQDPEPLPPAPPPGLDPELVPPASPPFPDPEPLPPTPPPDLDPEALLPAPPPDIDPEFYPPASPPDIDPESYPPTSSPDLDPPAIPNPDPPAPPSYPDPDPDLPAPPPDSDPEPFPPVPPPGLGPGPTGQPTAIEGPTAPGIGEGGAPPLIPIPGTPGIPGIPGLPGAPGAPGGAGGPGGPGGPGAWQQAIPVYFPAYGIFTTQRVTEMNENPESTATESDEYSFTCQSTVLSYAGEIPDYVENIVLNEDTSKKYKTQTNKKNERLK